MCEPQGTDVSKSIAVALDDGVSQESETRVGGVCLENRIGQADHMPRENMNISKIRTCMNPLKWHHSSQIQSLLF